MNIFTSRTYVRTETNLLVNRNSLITRMLQHLISEILGDRYKLTRYREELRQRGDSPQKRATQYYFV
jgi:hypothetical protein